MTCAILQMLSHLNSIDTLLLIISDLNSFSFAFILSYGYVFLQNFPRSLNILHAMSIADRFLLDMEYDEGLAPVPETNLDGGSETRPQASRQSWRGGHSSSRSPADSSDLLARQSCEQPGRTGNRQHFVLWQFKNRHLLCCTKTDTTTLGKLGRAVGFWTSRFVSNYSLLSVS